MKISEQLKAAKQIIINPEAWTTGTCARDPDGVDVGSNDEYAVCFCSFGAVLRAQYESTGNLFLSENVATLEMLKRGFGTVESIGTWNDSHTHEEVLAGFDNAIALAELEGV